MRLVIALSLAIAALTLQLTACSADHPAPAQPTAPPVPFTVGGGAGTLSFDVRFKGVGVLSDTLAYEASNFLVGSILWYTNTAGTPLAIGSAGNCDFMVQYDCSWLFQVFALPQNGTGLTTIYNGNSLSNFLFNLDQDTTSTTDTVITSLDIQSINGSAGIMQSVLAGSLGYTPKNREVALSALQSAATQEGAAGRVITAVSYDSGLVRYVSYGWQKAASDVYDAQVSSATYSTVASESQALAGAGYIITAFGGDSANGYMIIGTRPHGVTTPHSILVQNGVGATGYTVVAAFDAILPGSVTVTWIEER